MLPYDFSGALHIQIKFKLFYDTKNPISYLWIIFTTQNFNFVWKPETWTSLPLNIHKPENEAKVTDIKKSPVSSKFIFA